MDYLIYKGKCLMDKCFAKACVSRKMAADIRILYRKQLKSVICIPPLGKEKYTAISIDLLTLITAREKKERFRSFLKTLLKKRLSAKVI